MSQMILSNATAPDLHYGEKKSKHKPSKKTSLELGCNSQLKYCFSARRKSCRVVLYSQVGDQEEGRDIQHRSLVFLGGS